MTWGGRKVPRVPTCISPSPQMSPPGCLRSQASASRGPRLPFLRSPCKNKKKISTICSAGDAKGIEKGSAGKGPWDSPAPTSPCFGLSTNTRASCTSQSSVVLSVVLSRASCCSLPALCTIPTLMLEMGRGELDAPCPGRTQFHGHLPTEPLSLRRGNEQQPAADRGRRGQPAPLTGVAPSYLH